MSDAEQTTLYRCTAGHLTEGRCYVTESDDGRCSCEPQTWRRGEDPSPRQGSDDPPEMPGAA